MTSEPSSAAVSGQDSVVLASFESYRDAEHMVASLGGEFRRKVRKGGARVVVVRGNADGSLEVTASRVLEAGDFTAVLMHISLSWVVGFLGLFSMLKGARRGAGEARSVKGTSGRRSTEPMRSSPMLARMRRWCWSGAKISRRGRWSRRRRRLITRKPAGMARSRNFLLALIPVPLTTGCVRLSANPRARRARRAASSRLGRGQ